MGIDLTNHFEPRYIVPEEKQKVVKELKSIAKKSGEVWLASDEDREGESISWHLAEVLKLDPKTTKRIVFHVLIGRQCNLQTVRQLHIGISFLMQLFINIPRT